MGRIICIKASSHTDFELYLIGEKYDMDYDFLVGYKKNKNIYKFWTELGSGTLMAFEEREGSERRFVPVVPMSESEKAIAKSTAPIIAGSEISKYRGDIEEKEREFKEMVRAAAERKKQMLSRKYDPSNIVCINAKSTPEQIFAICMASDIDYIEPAGFIAHNPHILFTKVWYEKGTSVLVAYSYASGIYEPVEINEDCLIPRDAIKKMSMKAMPTPKLKATYEAAKMYKRARMLGFELDIPKLERFGEERTSAEIDMDSFDIEDLENLLQAAVESEDYESAAELRDAIAEMKKNKRNI